jgi:hypothetical protein
VYVHFIIPDMLPRSTVQPRPTYSSSIAHHHSHTKSLRTTTSPGYSCLTSSTVVMSQLGRLLAATQCRHQQHTFLMQAACSGILHHYYLVILPNIFDKHFSNLSRVWGSHCDKHEDGCLLGCSTSVSEVSIAFILRKATGTSVRWRTSIRRGTTTQKTANL